MRTVPIKFADAIWEAAQVEATRMGISGAELVRIAVVGYLGIKAAQRGEPPGWAHDELYAAARRVVDAAAPET